MSRFPESHEALNMGPNEKFNVIEVIDSLFENGEAIDCQDIYRGQTYWIQFESQLIVDKVKDYFRLMPSARTAGLYLIGTMIHEDLNCSWLEKERVLNALKYYKLHDALDKIYAHILDLFGTATNRAFINDTLNWIINLCIEIVHFNRRRMKLPNMPSPLETFKQTESGTRLLHFVENIFVFMLKKYPDDALFSLVRFSDLNRPVEERQFEWLLALFLNQFSISIISRFISYGGDKIRRICKDTNDYYQAEGIFARLYSPLILIMIVVQQRRQMETNIALQNILESYLKGNLDDNYDMIFLLKVCCSSPIFFDKVLSHISPLLTQRSIIQLCSILKDPFYPLIREGDKSFFECLTAAAYRFAPMKSVDLLEMLHIMAFDPSILENASNLGYVQQNMVREALKIVCFDILNTFVKYIHETKNLTLSDLPKYKELQTNDQMLRRIIEQSLEITELGQQRCKLLYCLCVISDIAFVRRVFAAFLYYSTTPDQLSQFTAFAATVVLHFPSAMLEAFKELVKRPNAYISIFGDETQRFQTFWNIMTLLQWAKDSPDSGKVQTSMFGLRYDQFVDSISMAELVGLLIRFAVTNLMIFLETIDKMDENAFEKLTIMTDFVQEINGAAPMESGMSFAISRLLSSIFVHCLRLIRVNEEEPNYGAAAILKYNNMIKHILTQRWEFSKNFFVSTLVKEVLMCSSDIFGKGVDLTGLRDVYYDGSVEEWLLPTDKDEIHLLEMYRQTTVRNERVRELIHSGVLKRRGKATHNAPQMSSERARSHFFFLTVQWLLTTPPESPEAAEIVYDALAIREVANSFVDVICSDKHHSSVYQMGDWYEEKINIGDHVDIAAKMDALPITFDLMNIFAEAPYPSLFCIATLLTAQLAVIVNQCELTISKSFPVTGTLLEKIERVLTLIAKAGVLTDILPVVYEMICRCTMHEASSLMVEIWRILTLIRPLEENQLNDLMVELNIRLHESPRGIVEMPEISSIHLLKLMNIIFMRNPEKMFDLAPKIISYFPPEPEEDSWEMGPLFPVIAVSEIFKR